MFYLTSCAGDFYKGNKYLAQAGFSKNAGQYGWSNTSLSDAENKAMQACEKYKLQPLSFAKNKSCMLIGSFINPNHPDTQDEIIQKKQVEIEKAKKIKKITKQRKLENEYDRYIQQCEYIGFKKDTDKMGECVLQMYNTEIKIAQINAQQRKSSSSDVLTDMLLLNESLKLINPPQKRGFNCRAEPFGVFTNIYCN